MGQGTDAARVGGPNIHADVIDDFKDQLLIVLLKRCAKGGNTVDIPLTEMDDTGQDVVSFSVNNRIFNFVLGKNH